jgi:crotonobetainyl-CoA:carnitine CoA-transferase CaiB-like acyl-CoA transferase
MRPGADERLKVSFEDQQRINPKGLYLYAPGWGSSGPSRQRQSFAPLLSGYVGASYEIAGQFNPPIFPLGNEDPGNGLVGAIGALMAVLHRTRSGKGQLVENPQLNAAMTHMSHIVRRTDGTVLGAERLDPLQRGLSALDRLYETSDGWICVVAMRDEEISGLERATGVVILDDDRFATHAAREEHAYELADPLENAFAGATTAEWMRRLQAEGVPSMVPRPYNNERFLRDPDNRTNRRVAEVAHPVHGHVRELDQLIRVSHASVPDHRLAPGLGEHTDQILGWLGYRAEQISALREQGAIR